LKFGQILSSRPDLLGPGYIAALSRLQDQVKPESPRAIRALLDAELGEKRARIVELSEDPVAAASVAQVHKGVLDDGSVVAVKIQRPGVEARVARDLALLRIFARLTTVSPTLRLMAIPGAVERFGHAMEAQLDFRKEAENNLRFAK